MTRKRATRAEKASRLSTVVKRLLDGETRADLVKYAADTWNVGYHTVDAYISEANQQIAALAEVDRRGALGQAIGRLNRLYNTAQRAKDYGLALRTQAELNRLLHLDQPPAPERTAPTFTSAADILAYLAQAAADAQVIPDAADRARAQAAIANAGLRIIETSEFEKRMIELEAALNRIEHR